MKSLGGNGIFLSRSLVEESGRSRFQPKSEGGAGNPARLRKKF
jgi:hypothetical protein